jgi:hypothetical protein
VVWHLQATLQELEIHQEDQQAILAAVQARRDAVVTFEESIQRPPKALRFAARGSIRDADVDGQSSVSPAPGSRDPR